MSLERNLLNNDMALVGNVGCPLSNNVGCNVGLPLVGGGACDRNIYSCAVTTAPLGYGLGVGACNLGGCGIGSYGYGYGRYGDCYRGYDNCYRGYDDCYRGYDDCHRRKRCHKRRDCDCKCKGCRKGDCKKGCCKDNKCRWNDRDDWCRRECRDDYFRANYVRDCPLLGPSCMTGCCDFKSDCRRDYWCDDYYGYNDCGRGRCDDSRVTIIKY